MRTETIKLYENRDNVTLTAYYGIICYELE